MIPSSVSGTHAPRGTPIVPSAHLRTSRMQSDDNPNRTAVNASGGNSRNASLVTVKLSPQISTTRSMDATAVGGSGMVGMVGTAGFLECDSPCEEVGIGQR